MLQVWAYSTAHAGDRYKGAPRQYMNSHYTGCPITEIISHYNTAFILKPG